MNPYPLCQKHGIAVKEGYVSWPVWGEWKRVPANQALMDKLPKHVFVVTVCEHGVPACDVEMWLAMATKARRVTLNEID